MNEIAQTVGLITLGGFSLGLSLTVLRGLWSHLTYKEQALWANAQVEIERAKYQHALPPQNFAPSYQIEVSPHYTNTNTNTAHGIPSLLPSNEQKKSSATVFDALDDSFHTLITGPTGSGKTFLINEIVKNRWAREGAVVVVDPDNHEGKWDSACFVLANKDYGVIDTQFDQRLSPVIEKRHAWYETHGGAMPKRKLHIIIDEAHDILNECSLIFERVTRLVKRGRKLSISVTLVTTDSQAGSLGLKGKMKLLTNMARCELSIDNGKRFAKLEGEVFELPGIYREVPTTYDDDQPDDSIPDANDQTEKHAPVIKTLDVTDDEIKAWLVEGLSKNQICKRFRGAKAKQLGRIAKVEAAMKTAS